MKKEPNLLIIWTDQQRSDTLPALGNDFVHAPNLKRLGEESFVFKHAYCAQPVCTPSRSTIMTGLWPHNNGCVQNNIPLRPETKTIAEMVSEEYECAYFGKWHLGNEVAAQHGFGHWISIEDNYRRYYSDPNLFDKKSDYYHFLAREGFPPDAYAKGTDDFFDVFSRPYAAAMGEHYTKAAFLGREASKFLDKQKHDEKPFLLSVNMLEPHPPLHGPLNNLYEPEEMPVGESFLVPPGNDISQGIYSHFERHKREGYKRYPLKTEWDWRRLRANYYGLVTLVDLAVGVILDALEESGHADDTVVVFTSDHGEMLGDHMCLGKGIMYEEATRIPLMIRVPWVSRKKRIVEAPISQIDLVPTLLELLGQIPGRHLQGKSRLSVLKGEDNMSDNHVIIEWNNPDNRAVEARTVVTAERFKLNLYHDDIPEFFDLTTDSHELNNLYRSSAHRDHIVEMTRLIRSWQEETLDKVVLST